MQKKIVTFGEILMRLNPEGYHCILHLLHLQKGLPDMRQIYALQARWSVRLNLRRNIFLKKPV